VCLHLLRHGVGMQPLLPQSNGNIQHAQPAVECLRDRAIEGLQGLQGTCIVCYCWVRGSCVQNKGMAERQEETAG
jgi:hypothetical protein